MSKLIFFIIFIGIVIVGIGTTDQEKAELLEKGGMNMKESEASTILKTEIVHHPEYSIFAEALGIAIQALEKQVPKKPDFTEDKEFALCPCCNGKGLLNKQKYCDNCGQKIDFDWSDAE